ncbi:MAG TPA: hypothetical protein VKA27_09905 [Sunxiuqinia sp.]|nr:hypothetical protein [Sunxiuqinia sp.]
MDLKEIKQILQRYFEGESSIEEEQFLHEHFRSKTIAPELEKYRRFFAGMNELAESRDPELESGIMDYILENEHREKNHYRWLWQTVSGVAAALIITLFVVNFYGSQNQWKDTYKNPDIAYTEAKRTLQFIAGQYQKGLAPLEPTKVLNTATKPMKTGLSQVNKGFKEVQKLDEVDKKLKKQ